MSNKEEDRFGRVDKAIDRVCTEIEGVVDESKGAGGEVRGNVRQATDDGKARIDDSRKTDELYPVQ